MINDQLLGYIRQQLSLNIGRETILTDLKSQGWTDADIHEAFSAIGFVSTPTSVPVSPTASGVIQNVAQPQTVLSNPAHSKSKKILLSIVILILLGLAGGGAYAYYSGIFVSFPSLFSKAMENARSAKSGSYDVTFNVDFSSIKDINSPLNSFSAIGINSKQLNFAIKGSSDFSDLKNLKNLKNSSVVSFTIGGQVSVEVELKLVDNTLYVKLAKAPTLGTFPLPIPNFAQYENKWFSVPLKYTEEIMGNTSTVEFTDVQKDKIYEITRDAHLTKSVTRLAPETAGGKSSYHFSFDLDKEGIISYIQSLKEYIISLGIGQSDVYLPKYETTFSEYETALLKKTLDSLKDFKGEIWIGRSDKLVHKLSLSFGIQPDATKDEQVKTNMVYVFSDYNQPVSVVAPSDSISIETLIGDSRQKGKEAAIKANLSSARAQAELFWDGNRESYSGLCASKESKTTRKAIEDLGGTGFVCKEKATAYAMGVKFPEKSEYWCVDSTGVSKVTTTLPSGTVCPLK